MKRRNFLKRTLTAGSVPLLIGGIPVQVLSKTQRMHQLLRAGTVEDRVLVLIQLIGGNDGLNTLIPLDQYSNLSKARPELLIPEKDVLNLNDETGLHPLMTEIQALYKEEKVGLVQSVGYPNPNFSHFRATDIWTTASEADEVLTTGWMGRYLEDRFPGYPDAYPSADFADPLAITIGAVPSTTCQGPIVNMGMAVTDPNAFNPLATEGGGEVPPTNYGHELNFIRQSMRQTNKYLTVVQEAAENGLNKSEKYETAGLNRLSAQLKIVAQLISGGLQTPIYVVSLGGFDTHANQVGGNDVLAGRHSVLLEDISKAVEAFQEDLELLGLADRVVGMTFSEFGRRIRSNDSLGTDHGAAAPLMVFGNQVNPVIHGVNPEIPAEVGLKDNVPMQYDFRSVYGSILMDWFEVSEAQVKELLFDDFSYIPILKTTSTPNDPRIDLGVELDQNYPNPFQNNTRIRFATKRGGWVRIQVFDSEGRILQTVTDRSFGPGSHELQVEAHGWAAGTYYYRMQYDAWREVKLMTKY